MRPLLPLLLAAALLPAASADAAWRELPSHTVPGAQAAACLRVSGDHVALLSGRPYDYTSELLTLTTARGPAPAGSFAFGDPPVHCPALGDVPGGAPLLAAPVAGSRRVRWNAMHVGATPQTLATSGWAQTAPGFVAGARDGSAIVAWVASAERGTSRLMVARRRAAAVPFGRPEQVSDDVAFGQTPRLATDDAGRATIAWQAPGGPSGLTARVARAEPGASFSRPQTLGRTDPNPLALTVAGDGRALVAAASQADRTLLWEATAADVPFARVALDAPAEGAVAPALGSDGSAVLATAEERVLAVWRRPAGGRFGGREPISITGPRRELERSDDFSRRGWRYGPVDETDDDWLAARLAPSGRFVVTFALPAVATLPPRAEALTGTVSGGLDGRELLGNVCRATARAFPTVLADGTAAAVWADDATVTALGELPPVRADGRVGVLLAGAAPTPAPAPGATAPRVTARVLRGDAIGPLRVRVLCTGTRPCDVRATAWSHGVTRDLRLSRRTWALGAASTTLRPGERTTLTIQAARRSAFAAPRRGGRTRIALTSCAPGGGAARETTVTARLRALR